MRSVVDVTDEDEVQVLLTAMAVRLRPAPAGAGAEVSVAPIDDSSDSSSSEEERTPGLLPSAPPKRRSKKKKKMEKKDECMSEVREGVLICQGGYTQRAFLEFSLIDSCSLFLPQRLERSNSAQIASGNGTISSLSTPSPTASIEGAAPSLHGRRSAAVAPPGLHLARTALLAEAEAELKSASASAAGADALSGHPSGPSAVLLERSQTESSAAAKGRLDGSGNVFDVEVSPISILPGRSVISHLGPVRLHLIREVWGFKETGGLGAFAHSFLTEAYTVAKAQVAARGGNALLSFQLVRRIERHE
jgi:hypothetical protein